MGSWNTSITGNDTAKDLYIEYCAAFYKYDVEEALETIDRYVRTELFDESDPEEWCNYCYSLADFMWKKGILTAFVRDQALEMIDSSFGLEFFAQAGQKTLDSRKQNLEAFKAKLLSPQPPKKKIKPNVHTDRIFHDGDIIALQLQTAGKPYTEGNQRPMSEAAFHALDGKYVLMQLVSCNAGWVSRIVPEVRDYWACFRLFDGIYDDLPEDIDVSSLKEAMIHQGSNISSAFTCESSLFYFKKRNYKLLCNRRDLIADFENDGKNHIFWSINKPWSNPDSQLTAAMGMQIRCCEFTGPWETIQTIFRFANRYGRYNYRLSKEENEARYAAEEERIAENIRTALSHGGKLYSLSFGREIGIVTVENGRIDNLYIEGRYQRNGFGSRLLDFAFSVAGTDGYMDVPQSNAPLLRVCEKIGLEKAAETADSLRMAKP